MTLQLSRRIIADLIAAMLVMALFAFNFAHAAPVGPQATSVTSFGISFCGSTMPVDGAAVGHAPCHACRIGSAADLPPAPAAIEKVVFAVAPVAYAQTPCPMVSPRRVLSARPRGPPTTV